MGKPAPKHISEQQRIHWLNAKRRAAMIKAARPKSDEELIAEAMEEGRVTRCPDAIAAGALRWGSFQVHGKGTVVDV